MNYVSTPVGYSMVKKGPLDKHMKFFDTNGTMKPSCFPFLILDYLKRIYSKIED